MHWIARLLRYDPPKAALEMRALIREHNGRDVLAAEAAGVLYRQWVRWVKKLRDDGVDDLSAYRKIVRRRVRDLQLADPDAHRLQKPHNRIAELLQTNPEKAAREMRALIRASNGNDVLITRELQVGYRQWLRWVKRLKTLGIADLKAYRQRVRKRVRGAIHLDAKGRLALPEDAAVIDDANRIDAEP